MPAARAGRAVWGHDAVCLDGLAGLGRGAGQLCPAGSGRNAPGSMTNRLVAGAGNSGAAAVLVAIRIAVLGALRVWPSCMSAAPYRREPGGEDRPPPHPDANPGAP